MSKSYTFLKECGIFYLLTVDANKPQGRPFGAVMEIDNVLYISTAVGKDVYKQLKENDCVQIIALKNGPREWIRIQGLSEECYEASLKEKMLEECPMLSKRFDSASCSYFALFKIKKTQITLHTDNGIIDFD